MQETKDKLDDIAKVKETEFKRINTIFKELHKSLDLRE